MQSTWRVTWSRSRLSTFGMVLASITMIMSDTERRGDTLHAVRFSRATAGPSPRPSPRFAGRGRFFSSQRQSDRRERVFPREARLRRAGSP
jgi:hypothetical protein